MQAVRLRKDHYESTKLEECLEYFECPICFLLKENILECPSCKSRACSECLSDFSKTEIRNNPQYLQESIFKCMICHKISKQMAMHRFLYSMLLELKFKCQDCLKTMKLQKLKGHKGRGECKRDGLGDEVAEHVIQAEFQPNAISSQASTLVKCLYVFERDSKFIHEYELQTNNLRKLTVDSSHAFPHNFQSVQMPSGRLFLVGGGDFNKVTETMYECNEIFIDESICLLLPKDKMRYPRHGHSACSLSDKFIVVTGSRKEQDSAQLKAECYNVEIDVWFELPDLNEGRHYHASCSFLDRFVYVFCGISNASKKYVNSIEKLDNQTRQPWEVISFSADKFPARQGLGVAQMNRDEILIFGGFNGKFMKDAHIFNCTRKQMRIADHQPQFELFAFQMPTVYESMTASVYTVDWSKMKIIQYSRNQWNTIADLRK